MELSKKTQGIINTTILVFSIIACIVIYTSIVNDYYEQENIFILHFKESADPIKEISSMCENLDYKVETVNKEENIYQVNVNSGYKLEHIMNYMFRNEEKSASLKSIEIKN